jgi:hypothetical protein
MIWQRDHFSVGHFGSGPSSFQICLISSCSANLGGFWSQPSSTSNGFGFTGGSLGTFKGLLESRSARSGVVEFDGTASYGFVALDDLQLSTRSFGVGVNIKIPYGVEQDRDLVSIESTNSFVRLSTAYRDEGKGPALHIILHCTDKISIPPLFNTLDTRLGSGEV